jgi:uncharacterized membrane protein
MVFMVVGILWMAVAVVAGTLLGRGIAAADRELRHAERLVRPDLEPPLYVADILAARRPSSASS